MFIWKVLSAIVYVVIATAFGLISFNGLVDHGFFSSTEAAITVILVAVNGSFFALMLMSRP